jgi:hypothetical protein
MTPSQLERLKRDAKETKHHLFRLQKQGKQKIASKVKRKYEFITSCIDELEVA